MEYRNDKVWRWLNHKPLSLVWFFAEDVMTGVCIACLGMMGGMLVGIGVVAEASAIYIVGGLVFGATMAVVAVEATLAKRRGYVKARYDHYLKRRADAFKESKQ